MISWLSPNLLLLASLPCRASSGHIVIVDDGGDRKCESTISTHKLLCCPSPFLAFFFFFFLHLLPSFPPPHALYFFPPAPFSEKRALQSWSGDRRCTATSEPSRVCPVRLQYGSIAFRASFQWHPSPAARNDGAAFSEEQGSSVADCAPVSDSDGVQSKESQQVVREMLESNGGLREGFASCDGKWSVNFVRSHQCHCGHATQSRARAHLPAVICCASQFHALFFSQIERAGAFRTFKLISLSVRLPCLYRRNRKRTVSFPAPVCEFYF